MVSENQAHRRRPAPLAIDINPTSPAAASAVTCEISCAIGAAWEMIAIPATVFRNSVSHNAYHCQLSSACLSVKSCCDALDCLAVAGWNPDGIYPSGGFLIKNAPARTTTKNIPPRILKVAATPTDKIS